MGCMVVGMERLATPSNCWRASFSGGSGEELFAIFFGLPAPLPPLLPSPLRPWLVFFFASLSRLSASQGAVILPGEAFLLLSHSAEPLSPAISAMVLPLITEVP